MSSVRGTVHQCPSCSCLVVSGGPDVRSLLLELGTSRVCGRCSGICTPVDSSSEVQIKSLEDALLKAHDERDALKAELTALRGLEPRPILKGSRWQSILHGHIRTVLSVEDGEVYWVDALGYLKVHSEAGFRNRHTWLSDPQETP